MAIIAIAGGLYFWFGARGVSEGAFPWIITISAISILTGIFLWLRVPGAKWLGALTFAGIICLGFAQRWAHGWVGIFLHVILPLVCMIWMIRIDYRHRFDPDAD